MMLMVGEQLVAALIVGYLLSVPYNIVVCVGVWRSADRYDGDPSLAQLAKLAVVTGMIVLSISGLVLARRRNGK